MRNWLSRKIHQLHSIMWFLGGFSFGIGFNALGFIALAIAIAIDVGISIVISKTETKTEQIDGNLWWSGIR